jgi:hypothetical protein
MLPRKRVRTCEGVAGVLRICDRWGAVCDFNRVGFGVGLVEPSGFAKRASLASPHFEAFITVPPLPVVQ